MEREREIKLFPTAHKNKIFSIQKQGIVVFSSESFCSLWCPNVTTRFPWNLCFFLLIIIFVVFITCNSNWNQDWYFFMENISIEARCNVTSLFIILICQLSDRRKIHCLVSVFSLSEHFTIIKHKVHMRQPIFASNWHSDSLILLINC